MCVCMATSNGNLWLWCALRRLGLESAARLVEAAQGALATVAKLFGRMRGCKILSGLTTALVHYTPNCFCFVGALAETDATVWPGRLARGEVAAVGRRWFPRKRTADRQNEKRFNKPRKPRGKKKSRGEQTQSACPNAIARNSVRRVTMIPKTVGPQNVSDTLVDIGCGALVRKLGPSYSSERGHLETLLNELRFPNYAVLR